MAEPSARAPLLRIGALVAALFFAWWLGVRAASPPAPKPADAPATAFSAVRAMRDVRALAMRPHPTGSVDAARVRAYLVGRLQSLGLTAAQRSYLIDPASLQRIPGWSGGILAPAEVTDVVGLLPGRDRQLPALLLMAHADTVWGSPGGADDSAGVAAILEALRTIRARGQTMRDIVVLFTDGEELGLTGASDFWNGTGLPRRIGLVLNLESRGAGGRVAMFETGRENGALIGLFARAERHPIANSIASFAYAHMPNDTDFTIPRRQGVAGLNFAMLGRAAYYHSPLATADRLDPATLQDMGEQVVDIAAPLATAAALPPRTANATYFDVGGAFLIHYRPGLGWLLLLGGLIAWGAAWAGARQAGVVSPWTTIGGAGAALWLAATAMLALAAVRLLSLTPAPNYYDRLAELPRLEVAAGVAMLGLLFLFMALRGGVRWLALLLPLLLVILVHHVGGAAGSGWATLLALIGALAACWRGTAPWGGWLGGLALLLFAELLLQAWVPLTAWVFAWPALILCCAAAIAAWVDPRWERGAGVLLAALAAVAVTAPLLALAHFTFLALGASMTEAGAALLPIPALAFWPLARLSRREGVAAAVALALLAAGLALGHRLSSRPLAPTVPAYSLAAPR